VLAGQLVEYAAASGDLSLAQRTLTGLEQVPGATDRHVAYLALARAYLDAGKEAEARTLLDNVPVPSAAADAVELAILHKRSKRFSDAHRIFSSVANDVQGDPKALHEFAQTKIKLASTIRRRRPGDAAAKKRLNREAADLLRRVIALASDQPARLAWAWFDLARVMAWLGEPETEVRNACRKAVEIEPAERRFREWLDERTGGRPGGKNAGRANRRG
jgi:ATP-dependent DNA helicase RecG